jgi:imidazole glycerol-phosphate synthase subunit HisH
VIALIDYGAGNLTSVRKGFAAAGGGLYTPSDPADLSRASAIVVPGVGHFGATAALDGAWRDAILAAVAARTPLLGVCLGLQWLFDGSEEAPGVRGLGLLRGTCRRLRADSAEGASDPARVKVPHVGWNSLAFTRRSALLEGVADGAQVYFTHSYAAPVTDATIATTAHSDTFASIVEREHAFGVQFHPEKSGPAGVRILRNFVALAACCRNA